MIYDLMPILYQTANTLTYPLSKITFLFEHIQLSSKSLLYMSYLCNLYTDNLKRNEYILQLNAIYKTDTNKHSRNETATETHRNHKYNILYLEKANVSREVESKCRELFYILSFSHISQ